jgi:hypothetical protein
MNLCTPRLRARGGRAAISSPLFLTEDAVLPAVHLFRPHLTQTVPAQRAAHQTAERRRGSWRPFVRLGRATGSVTTAVTGVLPGSPSRDERSGERYFQTSRSHRQDCPCNRRPVAKFEQRRCLGLPVILPHVTGRVTRARGRVLLKLCGLPARASDPARSRPLRPPRRRTTVRLETAKGRQGDTPLTE